MTPILRSFLPLLCLLLGTVAPASAQSDRSVGIGVAAGPVFYDYRGIGTGTGFLVGVTMEYRLGDSPFHLDAGIGYMRTVEQEFFGGSVAPFFVQDLQLQYQLASGFFRPYLGLGVGFMGDLRDSDERPRAAESVLTFCSIGSVGARFRLSDRLVSGAEWGVRVVEPLWGGFEETSYEFSLGVSWNLSVRSAP